VKKGKGGFRRLAVLFAVASVGVLAIGAHAASAASIEICKSSSNGMSGKPFTFHVNGGSAITVLGGRCTGAIQLAAGNTTITEDNSATNPTDVTAIQVRPSLWQVSQDLAARSVTINPGTSTSGGLVTFTNTPAGGNFGTLKVCKLTMTPAYLGRLFSFSANGGPIVSTEANDAFGDPADWSCRVLGNFQVGSNVTVKETIPSGTEVDFIDSDPATALVDFDTTAGTGVYNIGPGVTVALFDDEPVAPSGTGTLEICKTAAELAPGVPDQDVHGAFTFTAVDSAAVTYGPFTINVPSPNNGLTYCTQPFTVNAGIATVTEGASPGYDLVDVFTDPADRFLTSNVINRTVDVEVPSSTDPNDETQVIFVNQTQRAQLKICKALGTASGDLVNQVFYIDWSSSSGASGTVAITAQTSTQCVVVGNLPIGATVSLSERNPGQFIDSSGPSSITLRSGINTATFTNTARGNLEVCKALVSGINVQPSFNFRIDGGGILSVRAGTCSAAQRVSVGNHTVTEVASDYYELDPYAKGNGITVSPSSAEVSRSLNTRTITVNVPYAGDIAVTYYNRIKRGQIKVCKTISAGSVDSLGTKQWTYGVFVSGTPNFPNAPTYTTDPILPGECTLFGPSYPILKPDGTKRAVGVHENDPANLTRNVNYIITSIAVTGSNGPCTSANDPAECPYPTGQSTTDGNIDFFLGPMNNMVTFNNQSIDP
jgi:hypothetical protein